VTARYCFRDHDDMRDHARAARADNCPVRRPLFAAGQGREDSEIHQAADGLIGWCIVTGCALVGMGIAAGMLTACDAIAHAIAS
jgi:hypothetical protein